MPFNDTDAQLGFLMSYRFLCCVHMFSEGEHVLYVRSTGEEVPAVVFGAAEVSYG